MNDAEQERARVVEWLRQPAWSNMTFGRRLHFAALTFLHPHKSMEACARRIAKSIEAGEHLSEGSE
jgi:hypothetical protein